MCETALDVMLQLIVDDGVKNRSHRFNVFKKEFNVMACHTGLHKLCETMTCINYTGDFIKKG